MSDQPLLSCRGVTKYFGETGVLANDRIDFELREGERRAIVGENGAGKSTFARIVAGLAAPDSGEIRVRGKLLPTGSVAAAEAAGIGFVPQISLLAPELSAAENIALGREPRSGLLFVSRRKAYVEAAMLFERFGLHLDPDASIASLSAAERREVEIARALARGGEILILDEPTSILSEPESERLFELMRKLSSEGKAIVLVTHRVAELKRFAESVTVLRSGVVISNITTKQIDATDLASLMARSRAPIPIMARDAPIPAMARETQADSVSHNAAQSRVRGRRGEVLWSLRSVPILRGAKPLNLELRAGEILGVAALAGNGLDRLEEIAAGLRRPNSGELVVAGCRFNEAQRRRLRRGRGRRLGYVPSEREARGLCLPATLRDNALALRLGEFRGRDFLGAKLRDDATNATIAPFGLQARPGSPVSALSGGNRQRLLLARELGLGSCSAAGPSLFILAEPLQGLDIAAQAELQERILKLADEGAAVLLLGSNVEEIVAVADRVAALYRGELAYEGNCSGPDTAAALLAAMTGVEGSAR